MVWLAIAVAAVAAAGLAAAGAVLLLVAGAFGDATTSTTDAGFGVRRGPVPYKSEETFFEVQARPLTFEPPPGAGLTGVRFALSGIHDPSGRGWPVMTLILESDRALTTMSSPRPVLTLQGEEPCTPLLRKKYRVTQHNGTHREPIDFVFDPARVIQLARQGPVVAKCDDLTIKFSDEDTAALIAFSRAILTGSPSP